MECQYDGWVVGAGISGILTAADLLKQNSSLK